MLTNLPDESTCFVGRATELAELAAMLDAPGVVTVTGGAGVGKSRLALRAVRDREWTGFSAVCWTDLSPLRGGELLAASVADALHLSDHTARSLTEVLREWIGDRRVLLAFDSCEHLVESAADLVTDLVAVCPFLTVLVTSREVLGVPGERVLGLRPLDPAAEGVALFGARAAAAGRPLDDPTDRMVAERLCDHLEGVPLALELAAGLLRRRTVGEIWELAERRMDLPGGLGRSAGPLRASSDWLGVGPDGAGVCPVRHGGLRTAVGWSHELCRPVERLLWARLSVFPGVFDAELAAQVCSGGPLTARELRAALAGLVRKSVVTPANGGYRMLDSVRDYGRMWLRELDEETALAEAHAVVMLQVTGRAREEWLGPEQQHWYARMRDLHHDVCAAMEFLLRSRHGTALELLGNVAFFWVCSGHLHDVAHFAQLALVGTPDPDPRRVRGLWSFALARILQGEHAQGRGLAAQSLRAAAAAGDVEGMRLAAYLLGLVALLDGEPAVALRRAEEALDGRGIGGVPASGVGDVPDAMPPERGTAGESLLRLVRVFALTGAGRLKEARQEAEAHRDVCVRLGEYWTRSYLDYQLTLIALCEDRPEQAASHARDMLDAKRRIGDQFGIAMGLDLLAASLSAQDDPDGTVAAIAAGNRFWHAVGLLRRGTPEVLPLCERTRVRTRQRLGTEEYEARLSRAVSLEPEALLDAVLGRHGTG
ncbi:ATP-binding protein [Streptomyces sp. BYX5S]